METRYLFPGNFSPPTYGHFNIVKRASELFPSVTIVCSENKNKQDKLFTQEEAVTLWKYYNLPDNVSVITFDELKNTIDSKNIVMIRGIRNKADHIHESEVLELNHKLFGIDNTLCILADDNDKEISSTRVREAAAILDFIELAKMAHPMVVSAMLEKQLQARNVFLVVGKPASGKSAFLKMLNEINSDNYIIKTDDWSKDFAHIIRARFPGSSCLTTTVKNNDEEVSRILLEPWLARLKSELLKVPPGSNIFIEAAFGLIPYKALYRYIGGKILYVGCENSLEIQKRLKRRGEKHGVFLSAIPDKKLSKETAKEQGLQLNTVNSNCNLDEFRVVATNFNKRTFETIIKEVRL